MVADARARGSRPAPTLSITPRASASAKAVPAGIVKNRAFIASRGQQIREMSSPLDTPLGRSDMHPDAVEAYAVEAALLDRAVPKRIDREHTWLCAGEETR